MGTYILCQTKRAEKPFYIENISRNIYSLEELCYYLYHNLYLIDQSIMNESLCAWIERDLQLPSLAAKIRNILGKFADEADFVYPIFKEINYLSYQEIKRYNGLLQKMEEETPQQRRRKKADSMVRNGMLVKALQEYQDLLKELQIRDSGEEDPDTRKQLALLWHNMGAAYAKLFQFSKALECFENEWNISQKEESLITWLICYQRVRTPIEYESLLSRLSVSDETKLAVRERMERYERMPDREVYTRDLDEWILRLVREYHRSTKS